MNQIDWSSLPNNIKEKYESLTSIGHSQIVLDMLRQYDTFPLESSEDNSEAYKIFIQEYNSMLLTAHLFENLLMLEDMRHEDAGHNWFQIEIPVGYFRYPAFNNSRDPYSYKEMTKDEEELLSKAIATSKKEMNYNNDENIAKENLHKLEFLSMFSFLEAYLENILIEKYNYSEKEALKIIRQNSIDKVLKKIIDLTNPTILLLINKLKNNFLKFIKFCYLIRNVHTHNLGRANEKFIKIALSEELIYQEVGTTEDGKEVYFDYYRTQIEHDKIIKQGQYITTRGISVDFRNHIRECLFMIESHFITVNE